MFNRAWCKSYVNARRKNETIKGYRIFLSGPGGTGKSHVLKLIQETCIYFLHSTVNAEPDQPMFSQQLLLDQLHFKLVDQPLIQHY